MEAAGAPRDGLRLNHRRGHRYHFYRRYHYPNHRHRHTSFRRLRGSGIGRCFHQSSHRRNVAVLGHSLPTLLRNCRIDIRSSDYLIQPHKTFLRHIHTRELQLRNKDVTNIERELRERPQVFVVFVYIKKCFPGVQREIRWSRMLSIGCPQYLIEAVMALYEETRATVRTEGGFSPSFRIQQGTREGCLLSLLLFLIFC